MKLIFRLFLLASVFSSSLLFYSCGSSSDVVSNSIIQKRKYNKGFHFNLKSIEKQSQQTTRSEVKIQKPSTLNDPGLAFASDKNAESVSGLTTISKIDQIAKMALHHTKEAQLNYKSSQLVAAPELSKKQVRKIKKINKKIAQLEEPMAPEGNDDMNILALLSFIFSLVGILLLLLIGFPFFLPLAAIILGAIGLKQINKDGGKGKGLAIAGIVLGSIVVLLFILLFLLLGAFLLAL